MLMRKANMTKGQIPTSKGPYEAGRKLARLCTIIFPSSRPVAIRPLSKETAVDHFSSLFSMEAPILARVDESRNETSSSATVATNFPVAS